MDSPSGQQTRRCPLDAPLARLCLTVFSLFIVALLTTNTKAAPTQQPGITQSPISENSIAVLPPRQASQYDALQSDNPSLLQRRQLTHRPPPPARRADCNEEPRRCSNVTQEQAARVRVRRGPARGCDHEVELRHVAALNLAAPRRGEAPKTDGEILTYQYDSGGLPNAVSGVKEGVTSDYVKRLEYDKFEQRVFLKAGNDIETTFDYDPADRRLVVLKAGDFQNLHYTYDHVGNVTELDNQVATPKPKDSGGPVKQSFTYDGLYRLKSATGNWKYASKKQSDYSLTMAYDTIHNITKKTQSHTVTTPDNTVIPQQKTSYDVNYAYAGSQPHAPTQIAGSDTVFKGGRSFTYDSNGNQTGWNTLQSAQTRQITWDEENRVQEISDNGSTTEFKYNDSGERVIKRSEQGETAYVNQFFTVRNRTSGTKHVFIGESRMASTVVSGVEPAATTTTTASTSTSSNNGNGNGTSNGKANGAGNGNGNTVTAAASAKEPKDNDENFLFFYHPDHVGSTSYVTDKDGSIYQHVQYFPFGETWVEETSSTEKLPYLFTSKELDEETGLYYFGARYYDPRTSVWQSTDPMLGAYLDERERGGVMDPFNLSSYTYTWQNPIILKDPTGGQVVPPAPGRQTGARNRPPPPKRSTAGKGLEYAAGASATVLFLAAIHTPSHAQHR